MRSIDHAFRGVGGGRCRCGFKVDVPVAIDRKARAILPRCGGCREEGVCRKCYEERGVVEEGVFLCCETGDGEPGGEGEEGVIAPVAVFCRECRRC
jgi:hypothetical protein